MIDALRIERWSENIDSAITLVLEVLNNRMKYLDINAGTGGGGFGVGMPDLAEFEDKWKDN